MKLAVTVVLSRRGLLSLGERLELVRQAADVDDVVVAAKPAEAAGRVRRGSTAYLLDVNAVTAGAAAALWGRRQPYVVDTGDDPAALARARGSRSAALVHGSVERLMLRRAAAVVCRGSFHQPILRAKTRAPLLWAPDTVPDEILDDPARSAGRDDVVATFGSAGLPRAGDRAYGWEVVDLVARVPGLTGLLVVNGPGIDALRARAARLHVADRVEIHGARPLADMARLLEPAGFITSVQSDDLAGWVRTTGKLPIALGLGKALVTTKVGEASRILPEPLMVPPASDDRDLIACMEAVITGGTPPGWGTRARELAEEFRRSWVADRLTDFLNRFSMPFWPTPSQCG